MTAHHQRQRILVITTVTSRMIFKTSFDQTTRTITILVSMLFAFIIVTMLFVFPVTHTALSAVVTAGLVIIYVSVYAFRPVEYAITTAELIIIRPMNDVHISMSNIAKVELPEEDILRRSLRMFAVGGLFGHFGSYLNREYGATTWYATRRNRFVLITCNDKRKIVITPDEPVLFMQQFSSR